jgi:hypothetical protein
MVKARYLRKCRRVMGGMFAVTLSTLVLIMSACGGKDRGLTFGQSFNVIKGVSGDAYLLDGYTSYIESRSGAFAPNAVLIVGVKEVVVLGGKRFLPGAIIVVEGTSVEPTFRLATPYDKIIINQEVTVFGKKYKKGRFTFPPGGLTPTDI